MSKATRPDDLVPVQDAAALVDRSVSTIRAWVREGALTKYREREDDPNARVLVSRSALLAHAAQHANPTPGRPPPPPPEASTEFAELRNQVADLRRDLAVAEARQQAAESVADAERRRADTERERATDALREAERARAELGASRAELEALRTRERLPWWRRLLGGGESPALTGEDPDA
jgi:hypothetical protein